MKRLSWYLLPLLGLLVLVGLFYVLRGCVLRHELSVEEPHVEIEDITLDGISVFAVNFTTVFSVDNPNLADGTVNRLSCRIYVYVQDDEKWAYLGEGQMEGVTHFDARGTILIPVSVEINNVQGIMQVMRVLY